MSLSPSYYARQLEAHLAGELHPRPRRAENPRQANGRRAMEQRHFIVCAKCGSDWPARIFATGVCPSCSAIHATRIRPGEQPLPVRIP